MLITLNVKWDRGEKIKELLRERLITDMIWEPGGYIKTPNARPFRETVAEEYGIKFRLYRLNDENTWLEWSYIFEFPDEESLVWLLLNLEK